MDKAKKYIKIIFIVLILILIDQAVKFMIPEEEKILIPGLLKITYAKNTGGAFSIGSNSLAQIIIINIIILAFAIRFLLTNYEKSTRLTKCSLLLIISGGISNLANRIFLGYVIDYINVEDFIKFPIFNLADIFIVIRMGNVYSYYNNVCNKIKEIRREYARNNYNIGCTNR